jgi:hypothetical protein
MRSAHASRPARLRSLVSTVRFAWPEVWPSGGCIQSVSGPAATRKSLASFIAGGGGGMVTVGSGSSHRHFSAESLNHLLLAHQLCLPRECCLTLRSSGPAPARHFGRETLMVYAAPRGPSASPARAAQLKR